MRACLAATPLWGYAPSAQMSVPIGLTCTSNGTANSNFQGSATVAASWSEQEVAHDMYKFHANIHSSRLLSTPCAPRVLVSPPLGLVIRPLPRSPALLAHVYPAYPRPRPSRRIRLVARFSGTEQSSGAEYASLDVCRFRKRPWNAYRCPADLRSRSRDCPAPGELCYSKLRSGSELQAVKEPHSTTKSRMPSSRVSNWWCQTTL